MGLSSFSGLPKMDFDFPLVFLLQPTQKGLPEQRQTHMSPYPKARQLWWVTLTMNPLSSIWIRPLEEIKMLLVVINSL